MNNKITDLERGKNNAIIAYLTIIGCIIAMVMNSDIEKRSTFASFHIRQSLGLVLLFFALGYPVGTFNSWMVSSAFYIFFFILWMYGFLGAVSGRMNEVPLLGPLFQKLFKGL
ncbi:hypothetical protein AMR72_17675 [Flavobacterium psychrophilum]|nr:hypothetical protein AMR72_17675 [Flavobacterium psychrophilum]AOE54171.1 hypothetical protein ALW18_17660 [Flavobacterium psychrophilum]